MREGRGRDRFRAPHVSIWIVGIAFLLALAALAWRSRAFLPFFADDSFISLRYAQRLFHGQGLTWTDGERVEGYSNLLWVLLVGSLGRLNGDDYVGAARVAGVVCSAAAAASLLAFRGTRLWAWLGGALAALVLVLAPAVAVWSVGGLEQPLVLLLLAIALGAATEATEDNGSAPSAVPASPRARRWAAVAFALLCLARPDGILFVAVTTLALAALALAKKPRRARLSSVFGLALASAVAWTAQLLFRLVYYRDWVPNTAYAKIAFTPHRFVDGAHYLENAVGSMPLVALTGALGIGLLFTARRGRVLVLLAVHVVWAAYVMAIGGDIFPAYRHALPLLVTSALIVREAWLCLATPPRVPGAVALFILVGFGCWCALRPDSEIERGREEHWEWEAEPVAGFLKQAYGARRPLMAMDAAGALGYFAQFPSIDMLGLNDRHLAHHRPADFGLGSLAHELGDGAYVFERRPDLIVFCSPWGDFSPCTRSDRELLARPNFRDLYAPVEIEAAAPHARRAHIWVRREGTIGIERTPDRVRVPALFFTHEGSQPVRLTSNDAVELTVGPGQSVRTDRVALPTGRWRVLAEGVQVGLLRGRVLGEDGAAVQLGGTLELTSASLVDVVLELEPGVPQPARLSGVSFSLVGDASLTP